MNDTDGRSAKTDPLSFGQVEPQWAMFALLTIACLGLLASDRSRVAHTQQVTTNCPPEYKINPNVAPWPELAALPGIGPTLAKRIVAYRETQQPDNPKGATRIFRFAEDLQAVKGIGPKRAAALADRLSFPVESEQE
jgi:DNA uptake protein ComE-like DNA-binding protein